MLGLIKCAISEMEKCKLHSIPKCNVLSFLSIQDCYMTTLKKTNVHEAKNKQAKDQKKPLKFTVEEKKCIQSGPFFSPLWAVR